MHFFIWRYTDNTVKNVRKILHLFSKDTFAFCVQLYFSSNIFLFWNQVFFLFDHSESLNFNSILYLITSTERTWIKNKAFQLLFHNGLVRSTYKNLVLSLLRRNFKQYFLFLSNLKLYNNLKVYDPLGWIRVWLWCTKKSNFKSVYLKHASKDLDWTFFIIPL